MNQYIITEEELGGIIDITEDMCIQEGWVKEVVPLAQKRMSIINRVCSHPYQSKQGKVLDDIPDVLVCQSLPNEHGFCGKNDCFCKELQRVESGDICKWMQENRLHQSKAGEQ